MLMKKCFTLLMAALIVSVAAQNARADEIVYKSLGMGWMTDDMAAGDLSGGDHAGRG